MEATRPLQALHPARGPAAPSVACGTWLAAGLFIIRAAGIGDRLLIVLAAAGLGTILGAFAAGEAFVRDGQTSVSLTMAVLTGAALACYTTALGRLGAARRIPASTATVTVPAAREDGTSG